MNAVPTLDVRRYDHDRSGFVRELGASYRSFGFCCIEGHGLAPRLIEDAYTAFRKFFAQPESVKRRYHIAGGGGARGYTPFRVETAVNSTRPDLKEFWHVGREFDGAEKLSEDQRAAMPPNLWPQEVPEFRAAALALYRALDALGARLLRALALDLGLSEQWFDDQIDRGNSILRPLHYPPLIGEQDGSLRSAAHEDINLITLLIGASDAGLQIKTRNGAWLPITTAGDAIVVNVGDMLERLSNGVYPSTSHRVVNPQAAAAHRSRYSVPFFLHPNPDFLIETLPGCVDAEHPNRYPQPITAHQFLLQRLREIRLL
ncbi:MAG: oxidoreductase [Nevskia sp.]|nr:oxidoreductase [Nevskia sp.]